MTQQHDDSARTDMLDKRHRAEDPPIVHISREIPLPWLVGEYRGWLGSPWIPANVDADDVQMFLGRRRFMSGPDLHAGIYSKHTFQPAAFGSVQSIINRGWRVWLAERNPGMTAASALREYRQP